MKKLVLACLTFLCIGYAHAQLNMTLTDQIDYPQELSSLWGYIDPETGTEYAAVGTETGTAIVDLSDPYNIVEIAFMDDLSSTWREVKAFGHYVYAVTEAGGGVQVIDMHDVDNITQTHWAPNIPGLGALNTIHSITVDEFGYLYLNGSNLNSGGSLIVDARADDGTLTYVGKLPAIYCHDSYARDNKFYSSDIYDGSFKVYDISDRTNPVLLAAQETPYTFTHNTWLSDDSKTIFTTDERANAPVGIYDISDLDNIKELDQFRPAATLGQGVIPHNVHVWNDWVITAYYTDGTIILDGSRPDNVIEVGYFDSFVSNTAGFFGVWGVYPYFPSGLVIASDIQNGLLVYDVNYVRACWLEGRITNASTGANIQGASIHIESTQANAATSGFDGIYKTGQAIPGTFIVTITANGYQPKVLQTTLENGVVTILDVALFPLTSYTFSGQTIKTENGDPIEGAKVVLSNDSNEFTAETDANGNFNFPVVFSGNYDLYAGAWGYKTKLISDVQIGGGTAPVIVTLEKGYYDDFILDFGWVATNTASTGLWERGEPVGTDFNGNTSNTEDDLLNDLGDKCYVTGNGGGDAGDFDVDNGTVTLTSPVIDLTSYIEPVLKYSPWFFNSGGSGNPNDNMTVKISNGTTTVTLETITQSGSSWKSEREIDIATLIPLTNNMHVIFEASDVTPGHLVEAAVDGFKIEEAPSNPNIEVSVTDGCAPLTVQFNETSTDPNATWSWSFPGGTPSTSTLQNPTIVYNNSGVYSVQLNLTNETGNSTVNLDQLIHVDVEPTALFTANDNDLDVAFNNASSGATFYEWSFGDGAASNEANPSHIYAAAGTYVVTLTAYNACGSAIFTQTLNVIANGTDALAESRYQLTASPNPFADELTINYVLNGNYSNADLLIFNVYGQQVASRSMETNAGSFSFSTEMKTSGVYFIRLNLDGKIGKALRVVKI